MATRFLYTPLFHYDSIRILRLHGSPDEAAPLYCDIVECRLGEPSDFEAISYTWQGQKPSRVISCSGKSLLVTENCEAALRRFRPWTKGDFRLLWIDSICINQEEGSKVEKSRQVLLMGEIYAKARRVLVWLVPAFTGLPDDVAAHERNLRVSAWLSDLAELVIKSGADESEPWLSALVEKAPVEDLFRFTREIPWFKRIWVVQEVVLAKRAHIVYGRFEIPLSGLFKGRKAIQDLAADSYFTSKVVQIRSHLDDAFATHQMAMDKIPITEFMEEARYSQATMAEDNVFAIHGLLLARGLRIAPPNYQSSVASIYRQTAVAIIEAERSLELLAQVGLPSVHPGMSSWVPDWSHNKHCHPAIAILTRHMGVGMNTRPFFDFSDDQQELYVQGILVDNVVARGPLSYIHAHDGRGPATAEWRLNEAVSQTYCDTHLRKYPDNLTLALRLCNVGVARSLVAFAETLSYGSESEKWNVLNCTLHAVCWNLSTLDEGNDTMQRWFKILRQPSASSDSADTGAEKSQHDEAERDELAWEAIQSDPKVLAYHQNITQSSHYQTLFTTATGLIGLAPYPVQKGNQIALISGLRVPAILMPEGDHFRFVGLAYIYAIMDGQKWPKKSTDLSQFIFK